MNSIVSLNMNGIMLFVLILALLGLVALIFAPRVVHQTHLGRVKSLQGICLTVLGVVIALFLIFNFEAILNFFRTTSEQVKEKVVDYTKMHMDEEERLTRQREADRVQRQIDEINAKVREERAARTLLENERQAAKPLARPRSVRSNGARFNQEITVHGTANFYQGEGGPNSQNVDITSKRDGAQASPSQAKPTAAPQKVEVTNPPIDVSKTFTPPVPQVIATQSMTVTTPTNVVVSAPPPVEVDLGAVPTKIEQHQAVTVPPVIVEKNDVPPPTNAVLPPQAVQQSELGPSTIAIAEDDPTLLEVCEDAKIIPSRLSLNPARWFSSEIRVYTYCFRVRMYRPFLEKERDEYLQLMREALVSFIEYNKKGALRDDFDYTVPQSPQEQSKFNSLFLEFFTKSAEESRRNPGKMNWLKLIQDYPVKSNVAYFSYPGCDKTLIPALN